jgi:hypothetical protein
MGFFSSVSLMVRLGVFKRIRDVHSPSGWLYSASWRWIGPSYYRSQRHWFWLGPRGVGQRSKALCDGAVYARQFQCAYRSNNIVFFVLSSYFLYFCFVPFNCTPHRATMPLPKRDRKVEAAKRMIREAFEDLERAISPADSNDFGNATLESVQKAALDIENQLAARSSLRNMRRLMPLFSGLRHYSSAVEVLCNGTPYLPWIWAPIKLILKVSRGCCDVLLWRHYEIYFLARDMF